MKPIRTEHDYEQALARITALLDCAPGSADADELEVLALLVERYEERTHPVPPPHPIEAIKFAMEQRGLSQRDLEAYIGPSGRVSEVLSAKRGLSLGMIRRLHESLGIPAEVLIQDYRDAS